MKKNRVYGVLGISSKMSNWNADFTGRPKTTSKGDIFGSDKALKYPMKVKWSNEGEKVMYIKSYKEEKGSIVPKALAERYSELFGEKVAKNGKEVTAKLFECLDIMNFGATFAEGGANISITGAVQIGQGYNLYEDARIEVQDILSPFRNSKKEDAANSSLGTKIISDEAHYCYPFTVNPNNYNNYKGLVEGFEGYTKEAYEKFKEASLSAATAFATNSKFGCENEYGLFVEMKEDSKVFIPDLSNYIKFKKSEKNILDVSEVINLLSKINDVEKIEIYYNSFVLDVLVETEDSRIKKYNIITLEEVI